MKAIVIGGGFAGLCAATKLTELGHHVTLLERLPHLGGGAPPATGEGEPPVTPAPHLFFGHWRSARSFLERVGAAHKLPLPPRLHLALVDRGAGAARVGVLRSSDRQPPPPLDRVGALASFAPLSLLERGLVLRVLTALQVPNRLAPAPVEGETVDAWLTRLSQPRGARSALWHPLTLATLQTAPHAASARMFASALRSLLVGSASDAGAGVPALDARRFYGDDALAWLGSHGATVRLGTPVERIRVAASGDRTVLAGVELVGAELLRADAVISTVPPGALVGLLPNELVRSDASLAAVARLRTAATVTVHARFDVAVSEHDALTLAGSSFQRIVHRRIAGGSEVWIQASNADSLLHRGDAELLRLAEAELRAVLAPARARLLGARVAREPDASLEHPGVDDSDRPWPRTSVEGLFLAGDFVRTGLPANLESAARSADAAAMMAEEREPPPPPAGFVPVDRLRRGPRSSIR